MQVIDIEAMTSQFHEAGQYLVDNTHPAAWLSRSACPPPAAADFCL